MGQQPLIAPPDRPGDRSTEIAAHSPAPWRVTVHDKYTDVDCPHWTVAGDVSNEDARLIAAAPELLATLKRAWVTLSWCASRVPDSDPMSAKCAAIWDECEAAIAKATGG